MLPLPLGLRRAVELSTSLAGAVAGRWLADFGCEVIVLERPAGSPVRQSMPEAMRNKFSLQIDPATEEGAALCLQLAAACDLVLMDRDDETLNGMGLDYAGFAREREDIIVVSIGEGGDRPGLGVTAAAAALTALFHHRFAGRGQHVNVDLPLSQASLEGLSIISAGQGLDQASPDLPPSGVYRCRDRSLAVVVRSPAQVQALARVVRQSGIPEGDAGLDEALKRWAADRDAGEAAEFLRAGGLAAQELLTPADLRADPHLRAGGFFEQIGAGNEVHEVEGVRVRFSSTPAHVRFPAPEPGAQTHALLKDLLGLEQAEIERLEQAGVVGRE